MLYPNSKFKIENKQNFNLVFYDKVSLSNFY